MSARDNCVINAQAQRDEGRMDGGVVTAVVVVLTFSNADSEVSLIVLIV